MRVNHSDLNGSSLEIRVNLIGTNWLDVCDHPIVSNN
jgi:hypothetical protein